MSEVSSIYNLIVVKVGTSVLADTYPDGSQRLNAESFQRISEDVLDLKRQGEHVAIVTSASITAGMERTGLKIRPDKQTEVVKLQMLSSVGWAPLLNQWGKALYPTLTGSLQLTKRELDDLTSERNEALQTTHSILSQGYVPIINENDAITHTEIAFGDNDTLAATYAARMGKSALFGTSVSLVLLSDVHGVYEDIEDETSVIPVIGDIENYVHLSGGAGSTNGTGGMITKFAAARIATQAGVPMWITHGRIDNPIQKALNDEVGTMFLPEVIG